MRTVGPDGLAAAAALVIALGLAQTVVGVALVGTLFDLDSTTMLATAALIAAVDLLTTMRGVSASRPPGPGARVESRALLAVALVTSVLVASAVLVFGIGADDPVAFGSEVQRVMEWRDVGRPSAGVFDDLRHPGSALAVLAGAASLGGEPAAVVVTALFLLAVGAAMVWHLAALRVRSLPATVVASTVVIAGSVAVVVHPVAADVFLVLGSGTLIGLAVEHARLVRPRWRARRAVDRGRSQPWGAGSGRLVPDLRRLSVRSDRTASATVMVLLSVVAAGVAPMSFVFAPLVAAGWRRGHALASRGSGFGRALA